MSDCLWSSPSDMESIDELKNKLYCTNMELESTRDILMQERRKSHETVKHLLNLLRIAWQERDVAQKERDVAKNDLQALLNKILALKPVTSDHHDHDHNNDHHIPNLPDFTNFYPPVLEDSDNTSDQYCYASTVLSPNNNVQAFSDSPMTSWVAADHNHYGASCPSSVVMDRLIEGKALPEKGQLLQAVVEAGPLLQTLLLAPIPQWKNPPPPPPPPKPLPLPNSSLQISPSNLLGGSPTAFNHVSQLPPSSSSSCLDIAKQMINLRSGPNFPKSQFGGNAEGLTSVDYMLNPSCEN